MIRRFCRDKWFCRQLAAAIIRGPTGICLVSSATLTIASLAWHLGLGLNTARWLMWISPFGIFSCVLCAGIDARHLLRNSGWELIRRVARKSQVRLRRIKVEFEPLEAFLQSPLNEARLRNGSMELRLIVEALDRLTITALRYGVVGRGVFERNAEPISIALTLVRVLPEETPRPFLNTALARWLREVPVYDPEGWSQTAEPRQLA
jgi:hypothetical protein